MAQHARSAVAAPDHIRDRPVVNQRRPLVDVADADLPLAAGHEIFAPRLQEENISLLSV